MVNSVELEPKNEEDVKPLLIENKMSDRYNERKKIGPYASRSERNAWAVEKEDLIRSLSPWPITYDVGAIFWQIFSDLYLLILTMNLLPIIFWIR